MGDATDRVSRIFRFLQALHQHRNPVTRLYREQPWFLPLDNVPDHPAVELIEYEFEDDEDGAAPAGEAEAASEGDEDDYLFRVKRPAISAAPAPPEAVADWLDDGWDDPFEEARPVDVMEWQDDDGSSTEERFTEKKTRVDAFKKWRDKRDEWARRESPTRKAYWFYEQLYELYRVLQRESERTELMVGDGVLKWGEGDDAVEHPILLQKVQLVFDPGVPEFRIVEAGTLPELYTGLLRDLPEVDGETIQRIQDELERGDFHPLAGDETTDFLRRVVTQVSQHGHLETERASRVDAVSVGRRLVLFLRRRDRGFTDAISAILKEIADGVQPPTSLLSVVGSVQPAGDEDEGDAPSVLKEVRDILLSKPANAEQIRIARLLEKQGAVLVQGPPGTGKSHTIANLIGHALAKGESVLVTAQTTKALRVLRQHLPEPLRPLCVSVLEADMESRMQLEGAVAAIAERISTSRPGEYEQKSEKLEEERTRLLDELDAKREQVFRAVASEYAPVTIDGVECTPAEAAAKLAAGRETHGWIPGEVGPGDVPLSDAEIKELYASNARLTTDDEGELARELPRSGDIPNPEGFGELLERRSALQDADRSSGAEYWGEVSESSHAGLAELVKNLGKMEELQKDALSEISEGSEWRMAVITAGYKGGVHREPWDGLLAQIREYCGESAASRSVLLEHDPQIERGDAPADDLLEAAEGIVERLEAGGSLGWWTRLWNAGWKYLIRNSRVMDGRPKRLEHFKAIRTRLRVEILLSKLQRRWDNQVAGIGGPPAGEMSNPEDAFRVFGDQIEALLSWRERKFEALRDGLVACGFKWTAYADDRQQGNTRLIAASQYVDLDRVRETLLAPVAPFVGARVRELELRAIDAKLAELSAYFATKMKVGHSDVAMAFAGAVDAKTKDLYTASFMRLRELERRSGSLDRRGELLERLAGFAPKWSAAIRKREGVHGGEAPPGDVAGAVAWKRTAVDLAGRCDVDVEAVQHEIAELGGRLRTTTVELIITRAWAHQLKRAKEHPEQKQSLIGWLDTMKRLGAGTSKRAATLNRQLRKLMGACRTAVPIWVMPMSRIPENFDFSQTRFDVVIVDEASQSDVMALMALWVAKKIVIVGDHEQVSPSGVGQQVDAVEKLIGEHLDGIPNAHLYDGRMSVYDLARQSFGQAICLLEHFRCAPDIIGFSNIVSYNGRIKPLRDSQQISLRPSTVAYHVRNGESKNKINEDEALATAGLLVAATEQPEYEGRTMGVISMVGEDQALKIERQILEVLEPRDVEQRRIISGNPAQFQGDERDVMFISMVDAPPAKGGTLSRRSEDMFRQRFNVAASRAKDQMWVVHSLEPGRDLKDGDLRRTLIQYADNPESFRQEDEKSRGSSSFVSQLEGDVAARLRELGYRVQERFKVGYYTIDLVVYDEHGKRLALVCDGAAARDEEQIAEQLARQATLERLGWKFARIRASQFFVDVDAALRPAMKLIEDLGIQPTAAADGAAEEVDRAKELVDRVVKRARDLVKRWKRRLASRRK